MACAVSSLLAANLEAQRDSPNAEVAERAISQLRSPYCPGLMLEVCPSQPAALLRDSIYALAAQGATTEELIEWMLANHGEEYRGVPERSGVGLWAWILPPLALVVGAGLLISWLRSNRAAAGPAVAAVATPLSDREREELAQAVRDWEAAGEEEL